MKSQTGLLSPLVEYNSTIEEGQDSVTGLRVFIEVGSGKPKTQMLIGLKTYILARVKYKDVNFGICNLP
ncbi:hypothetical protein J22TS3_46910 [Paenibacillus sp. J22TS3]|nr:hypothetical protein J22TS3_46910 [Paenibacillus sp. J22TS3]